MDRPESISPKILNAAYKADMECQRNSCKDEECNGFLCLRAIRAAILKAKNDAYEEALRLVVHEQRRMEMIGDPTSSHVLYSLDSVEQAIRNLKHEG